jgi:hypothetical protein
MSSRYRDFIENPAIAQLIRKPEGPYNIYEKR